MPLSRYIKLTEEEDPRLREIEQNPYLRSKVRLRAQVLRLSNRGSNIRAIASYTGRSRASIARDLERFRERGFEGLADGTAPGNPPLITEVARRYIEERLTEERTWNATQLAEALGEEFGLEVTPEAVRQHLRSMGYSWKRTRYVPNKPPNLEQEREAREELEALKKGSQRRCCPEVSRRERLLPVPFSYAHLGKEGTSSPASGEEPVGLRGARQPHGHALYGRRGP